MMGLSLFSLCADEFARLLCDMAALLIIAVMRLMDYHNKKVIALTTVLTLLFIYLVFGML